METSLTATEFNEKFDYIINTIKDAKIHWMVYPSTALAELKIAKSYLEELMNLF